VTRRFCVFWEGGAAGAWLRLHLKRADVARGVARLSALVTVGGSLCAGTWASAINVSATLGTGQIWANRYE